MTRSARAMLTFVTGTGASVVLMAVNFVTLPFVLAHLGDERYGIFRAMLEWFGWLTLLDIGVSNSLGPLYAKAMGRGDPDAVVRVAHTGMAAFARLAAVMAAVAVTLSAFMPRLVSAPPYLTGEVYAAAAVSLLGVLLLPLNAFRFLADAGQRGYFVSGAAVLNGVTISGLSVLAAWAGLGLAGQSLAVFCGTAAMLAYLARDGARRYPGVLRRPAVLAGDPAVRGEFRSVQLPWFAFNLTGRLGIHSHNLLVAALLGPAPATAFFVTQRLTNLVYTQLLGVGNASWAALAELYHRGERERFAARMLFLTRSLSLLGAAVLVPVGVWTHALVGLWVGPDRYAGPGVTWPAAALAWVQAVVALWTWPLTALGRVRRVVPPMVAATVLNLLLSVSLTLTVGLPGPVVGAAVAQSLLALGWLPRLLSREFDLSARALRFAALGPLPLAVGYGLALAWLADALPLDPAWPKWGRWLALAAGHAAGTAGFLALAWLTVVPAADRREYAHLARRVLRR